MQVVSRQRYLGVQLGHASSEQAFAPALAKIKAKVMVLKTLPLDQLEKAELYKVWIRPIINLPARVYEPDSGVLSSMNVIFKTALGVMSWGLALGMVAEVCSGGGLQTQSLPMYARFTVAPLWVSFVQRMQLGRWYTCRVHIPTDSLLHNACRI